MISEFVLINFIVINKLMEIFLLNKQRLVYTIGISIILTVSLLILIVIPQNSFSQPTTTSTNMSKPIDGYNLSQGHLTAIRHVFDDPSLRVHHYCKIDEKIFLVCQLYDSHDINATLIGVEYIITAEQYTTLPDREKPNWHYHKIEFAFNRADPKFPELNPEQAKAEMQKAMDTYGKVIITWNPNDLLPAFPPREQQVEHPFMVNSTVKPETMKGSFNQTLDY
jgi:hypothetical protein